MTNSCLFFCRVWGNPLLLEPETRSRLSLLTFVLNVPLSCPMEYANALHVVPILCSHVFLLIFMERAGCTCLHYWNTSNPLYIRSTCSNRNMLVPPCSTWTMRQLKIRKCCTGGKLKKALCSALLPGGGNRPTPPPLQKRSQTLHDCASMAFIQHQKPSNAGHRGKTSNAAPEKNQFTHWARGFRVFLSCLQSRAYANPLDGTKEPHHQPRDVPCSKDSLVTSEFRAGWRTIDQWGASWSTDDGVEQKVNP